MYKIKKGIAEELYPLGAQIILAARNVDELNKVKNNLMKVDKLISIIFISVNRKIKIGSRKRTRSIVS